MKRRQHIIIVALLTTVLACNLGTPSAPPSQAAQGVTPPITPEFVPTAFTITPTYEGCAYVWGSKDLPELSRKFNAALQEISLDASGIAYAFGENCVYGDGHSTFGAMETDFRVGIKIKNIKDEAALGDWIMKVMQVVLALPQSELAGPNPGKVDFDFKQPDPAELFVTVQIQQYREQAQGLRGAELFHFFYKSP